MTDPGDSAAIVWDEAGMAWAPEMGLDAMRLTVPAWIEGYAAHLIRDRLQAALYEIASDPAYISIHIEPTSEVAGSKIEGQIVVASEHFFASFNAAEMRKRMDLVVGDAIVEGDKLAKEDYERAQEFLGQLAAPK